MTEEARTEQQAKRHDALVSIRHTVLRLHEIMQLQTNFNLDGFLKVLDSKLTPRLDPEYPLMVAITAGGNSGKSSLFNALVQEEISAVKARAGHSRRVLAGVHPSVLEKNGFMESLFSAFDAIPEKMTDTHQLTEPGPPVFVACEKIPRNLVLLDTPDFDVGDTSSFANRDTVKPVLEASDILLYLFINGNFNNRENTIFLQKMLTGVGWRKAALLYRCSRAYSEEEVQEHIQVVQNNLFEHDAEKWMLGTFRINEDDAVASGSSFMQILPFSSEAGLYETLENIDVFQTREQIVGKSLQDVTSNGETTYNLARLANDHITLYQNLLRTATSKATTEALKSFPKEDLLKRFLKIWEETQPIHLKVLKTTSNVVSLPLRGVMWSSKKVRKRFWKEPTENQKRPVAPDDEFQKNLFEAANMLRNQVLSPELAVEVSTKDSDGKRMIALADKIIAASEKTHLPSYESIGSAKVNMRMFRPAQLQANNTPETSWEDQLHHMQQEAKQWAGESERFDQELYRIALEFRANLRWKDKAREFLTASLPPLAAVAASTYVVFTGDPLGAGGIYAHLVGMFGMNDLFALIAIPAATGLSAAHRKNLGMILAPIYEAWFNGKADKVRSTLEEYVTKATLETGAKRKKEITKPLTELKAALDCLRNGV